MRPNAWRAWEKSDDKLFDLFIGARPFKIIKTAHGVSMGPVKSGEKKDGDVIEWLMRLIYAARPERC